MLLKYPEGQAKAEHYPDGSIKPQEGQLPALEVTQALSEEHIPELQSQSIHENFLLG